MVEKEKIDDSPIFAEISAVRIYNCRRCRIVIDVRRSGVYYFACDHTLTAIKGNQPQWTYDLKSFMTAEPESVAKSPLIADDGTLYMMGYHAILAVDTKDPSGLAKNTWARFRANNQNTGSIIVE
jgi:hypothetical protein